jgi:hypothetical protein
MPQDIPEDLIPESAGQRAFSKSRLEEAEKIRLEYISHQKHKLAPMPNDQDECRTGKSLRIIRS